MSTESFLDGKITLRCGDSRDVLKTIPDCSIDSIVTDPPYALVSIVKRFGGKNAAAVKVPESGTGAYARASAGFMGKAWDTGETAFAVDFWAECLRVLKPGGHVVAFSGTRTYHRMACAIEDAGFEVRDMLSWLYGSGFPKSHDVSKGIDKRPGVQRHPEFAADLRAAMAAKGFTNTFDVAEKVIGRRTGAVANWQKYQWPEAKWWPALRDLLDMDEGKWGRVIAEADRERTGSKAATKLAVAPGQGADRSAVDLDITSAATHGAREWEGWGTALKPACEPICFGRKPLTGTVAANVLEHGTGAINIDGCRVGTADELQPGSGKLWSHYRVGEASAERRYQNEGSTNFAMKPGPRGGAPEGRWPANIVHDGSEEVVAAFPAEAGAFAPIRGNEPSVPAKGDVAYGFRNRVSATHHGDSGSAARFFYTAKADADDRLGSKHPTVKPVDLMQWLCRLVTPPGGTVLDPFSGTGTTGEAAFREGFKAVLIEREPEYQADIRRRMGLVLSGPDERAREGMKARLGDAPADHGPLFGGLDTPPRGAGGFTESSRTNNRTDRNETIEAAE